MYYYIANPASGGGAMEDIQSKLRTQLKQFDPNPNINKTTGEGDAKRLVKKALSEGYKTIVAIGGDTTVREVITAVYEQKPLKTAVGIVPIGKHNTLASQLGIRNWQQACSILANRRLNHFNLLEINDQLYLHGGRLNLDSNKSFSYKLELDGAATITGQAQELRVFNQKFHSPELDNTMKLEISPATDGNWGRRLKRLLRHSPSARSQLPFQTLKVASPVKLAMSADGEQLPAARSFSIKASAHALALITNRAL